MPPPPYARGSFSGRPTLPPPHMGYTYSDTDYYKSNYNAQDYSDTTESEVEVDYPRFSYKPEASAPTRPNLVPEPPSSTVPATISEDNTNKDLVIGGLLGTVASRQTQGTAETQQLLGTISSPNPSGGSGGTEYANYEAAREEQRRLEELRHRAQAQEQADLLRRRAQADERQRMELEARNRQLEMMKLQQQEERRRWESTVMQNALRYTRRQMEAPGGPPPERFKPPNNIRGIDRSRIKKKANLGPTVPQRQVEESNTPMGWLESGVHGNCLDKSRKGVPEANGVPEPSTIGRIDVREEKSFTDQIDGQTQGMENVKCQNPNELGLETPKPSALDNGPTDNFADTMRSSPNHCSNMMSSRSCTSPVPTTYRPIDTDDTDGLRQKIAQLESQITALRKPSLPEKQTLYRIFCANRGPTTWLDRPRARSTRRKTQHYEADIPIPDERAYFKRNKHIHFVVYHDLSCCGYSTLTDDGFECDSSISSGETFLSGSEISFGMVSNPFAIISLEFRELLSSLQAKARIKDWNHGFQLYERIFGPHNCILRHIDLIRTTIFTFNHRQQYLLNLLFDFIEEAFGSELYEATEQFHRGYVSEGAICYLMGPDDIIVTEDKAHRLQAYIIETWPIIGVDKTVSFKAWCWKFNGAFKREEIKIEMKLGSIFGDFEEVEIKKLKYYPLQYAALGSRDFLERRGLEFWRCRHRRFASYSGWDADNNEQFVNVRFMIDTMTYRRMHPQSVLAKESLTDDLGDRMEDDSPLQGDAILVFPPTIYGFHVQEKKWFNLKVDDIKDISWNKKAFDSLVIDESTKTLIVALVSNKIAADVGTDLMSNKGNGLIILLHGVAEHAEKPLYRVTTGDVGTNPEAVEKYLNSVLYLGKIWGCVVLLDEADVFLEERTLSDLTRNALVSVFLRVLEYYDGILILTSNRVGTFDSAFKSRIQLAIHYDNLSPQQRIKIWESFIRRLEDIAYNDIDIDELSLDKNIKKLAKHSLNGRQIRNNITTARQLALYKEERMNMSHLETVIEVSQKFETYLQKVKSGTDEDIARDEGLR
ncbi:hypothetical protein TWF718_010823 [Orbilia javanica]|uniref:ATPase AAA-type core domain-containing protein n=1 Tax=Orbilia javanica TaxID=47235 RepID=A0AAN8RBZ8_9PEZI